MQEATSAINDGQGNFVFTSIEPGTYRMVIGSDINGDNSWGSPGEMSGASANFEITDSNVSDLSITLSPELAGEINNAPVITSSPFTDAYVNQPYFYGVRATDEDGDSLSYSIELVNRETGQQQTSYLFHQMELLQELQEKTMLVSMMHRELFLMASMLQFKNLFLV